VVSSLAEPVHGKALDDVEALAVDDLVVAHLSPNRATHSNSKQEAAGRIEKKRQSR
jgi:hypothetical protein